MKNSYLVIKRLILMLMLVLNLTFVVGYSKNTKGKQFEKRSDEYYKQIMKMYMNNDMLINELKKLNTCSINIVKANARSEIMALFKDDRFANNYDQYGNELFYIDVSSLGNDNNTSTQKYKIFITGGEHARELVSVESTLGIVRYFCQKSDILSKVSLRVILNANPLSRNLILQTADVCLRVNPYKVDLNRNWDYHHGEFIEMKEEYPGESPLSEPENRFISFLVDEYKPNVFLSIHSGEFSIFRPFAYEKDSDSKKAKFKVVDNIFEQIKTKYCPSCKFGSPADKIGYLSSGSSLDYYFSKGILTFAYEVYTQETPIPFNGLAMKKFRFKEKEKQPKINYDKLKNMDTNFCYETFNPPTKDVLDQVVNYWSETTYFLFDNLYQNRKKLKKLLK